MRVTHASMKRKESVMSDTSIAIDIAEEWDIEIVEADDVGLGDDEVGIIFRSSTSCTSC